MTRLAKLNFHILMGFK